jgi:hypothetical protein
MPKQIMLQLPAPHPALSPIRHRSEQAQADLIMVRARAVLVEARTALINAARGLTKSYGERLPSCGTNQMGRDVAESLSPALRTALDPLLEQVEEITERIREYDRMLGQLAKERYPEVDLLTQVHGVGILIALTFVLTVKIHIDSVGAGTWAAMWDCGRNAGSLGRAGKGNRNGARLHRYRELEQARRRLFLHRRRRSSPGPRPGSPSSAAWFGPISSRMWPGVGPRAMRIPISRCLCATAYASNP